MFSESRKVNFLIVILCLFAPSLAGQVLDPYFINYSIDNGLPSSEVYDLEIDSLQRVWATTDRGVVVYDGYDFKSFSTEDGLADNTNFEIFKDPENRLWFTGYNQTLSYYKNGQFHSYKHNNALSDIVANRTSRWVSDVFSDENDALYFVFNSSEESCIYKIGEASAPEQIDFDLDIGNLDSLAITGLGFITFNGIGLNFIRKKNYTRFILGSVVGLQHKDYWFYTSDNLLFKRNTTTKEVTSYPLEISIDKLFIDDRNNLWVCSQRGIYCFKNADISKAPIHYFKDFSISSIVQDFEGNYWLSSNESGILFVPSFEIDIVEKATKSDESLNFLTIGTLKHNIVFGTSNSNILSIDKKLNKKYYQVPQIFLNTQVNSIRRYGTSNKLYLLGGGVLTENNDKLVVQEEGENEGDHWWGFMLNNGDEFLYSINGYWINDHRSIRAFVSRETAPFFSMRITVTHEDKENNIWIGTLNGLFRIRDYDYKNIEEVLFEGKSMGRVNDLKMDRYDNLWVGTVGSGMFCVGKNSITNTSMANGLSSNMINQILITGDTMIWLASNNGINKINYSYSQDGLRLSQAKTINTFDGLPSNYVNDIDLWEDKIWLATNNGVCSFEPGVFDKEYPEVPVIIDYFLVNDSCYLASPKIELDHSQNDIFIGYTGVRYRKNLDDNYYKYRLIKTNENNKDEWFATNEKSIRYNDLSHGDYRFELQARNKIGEWNSAPTILEFAIKPHISDTLWFKVLCVLLLAVLIGLVYYSRLKRFRARALIEKEFKEMQLKSKAFELASLRNQMNPHFVFNSLNSIQNFIFKKDVKKANYYLTKFSSLMRDSLQYTRLEFIPLSKELKFLENYLELEAMRFPDKFTYSFELDDQLDIDGLLIPPLLLQPIIENSVKHAFKDIDYKGEIEILIEENSDGNLYVRLSDNGVGRRENENIRISNPKKHTSLGLEIVNNRIDLMNKSRYNNKAYVKHENLFLGDRGFRVHIYLPITYEL